MGTLKRETALAGNQDRLGNIAQRQPSNATLASTEFDPQSERRLYRHAERICDSGPRVLFELLERFVRDHGDDVLLVIAEYADVDADLVRAIGANWFTLEIVPDECGGEP